MGGWLTPDEQQILLLTLKISLLSATAGLPLAVAVAWLLARKHFFGKALLDGLVHLPLALPPVVTGYLLLITLGSQGPVGKVLADWFDVRLIFTTAGAAVATAVMTFPLMVRAIRLSLEAVDQGLEDAARSLGAGPVDRFVTIVLPLAAPGLLSGAIMAFAAGLGEFGAVITFASNIPGETRTLPLAIYSATQVPGGDALAARLATISFVLALTGLILSDWAARRVRRLIGQA